jgi:Transposase DDE domain
LKVVLPKIKRFDCLDLVVQFNGLNGPWLCRLVIYPNLKKGAAPRYLITNLDADSFSAEHISDAYRLRWQVELLFKEWKSYANLRAFDTANPHIAEGLIWAALCAATLNRYCAHATERIFNVAMSTHTVAKCLHHVLVAVLQTLVHRPRALKQPLQRALRYLGDNATRAKPERDKKSGRLRLGLVHVHVAA